MSFQFSARDVWVKKADFFWVTVAELAVEHIEEIKFNPDAFGSLVLPEAQKTIVRALVESHTGNKGLKITCDDVIKGKGKGLVAVLQWVFPKSIF